MSWGWWAVRSSASLPLPNLPQRWYTHIIVLSILVTLTTVAAGEGHTVGVNVQLTHFTAERRYLQALAADHTELALVETKGTKAVGYRDPDEAWRNACARGLHLL